jgi:hypothetical protein
VVSTRHLSCFIFWRGRQVAQRPFLTGSHAHPLVRDALLLVAGRSGKIETRLLGNWLGKSAGRIIDIGEDGKAGDNTRPTSSPWRKGLCSTAIANGRL